jgi:hypothetical protein
MRGRHWRHVGSRAAAKKTGDRGDLQRYPPLFTFLASGDLQLKKNTSNFFYFIFFFSDLSSLFLHLSFFQITHFNLNLNLKILNQLSVVTIITLFYLLKALSLFSLMNYTQAL